MNVPKTYQNEYKETCFKTREIVAYNHNTIPSDRVYMSMENNIELHKLLINVKFQETNSDSILYDPCSDIFFANTIPLLDSEIELDFHNGKTTIFRVVIFQEHIETLLNNSSYMEIYPVGYIYSYEFDAYIHIGLKRGSDLVCNSPIHNSKQQYFHDEYLVQYWNYENQCTLLELMENAMTTWYAMQIALLHPLIKDIFKNPQRKEYIRPNQMNHKNKRKTVRYVRYHVLNAKDIKNRIYDDKGTLRHTMV